MKEKVNNLKTIITFSLRILVREWRKFILPFLSLTFTAIIIFTVLLFTNSSSDFLEDKNKELIGGDISIESNYELDSESLGQILGREIKISNNSVQYDFSGILIKEDLNTPVSISVVDSNYPVYGGLSIKNGTYATPTENEIYIDTNAQSKLNVEIGETLIYANNTFVIKGIIEKDSKSLLSGFSFLPKVIISKEGFNRVQIDKSLLRAEYTYTYIIDKNNDSDLTKIIDRAKSKGVNVDIAGITNSGFVEGLALVKQFLVLAVLLSCILSAVNIYAGMLYILTVMRKSFAILLAIGLNKKRLATTLSLCLFYILVISSALGASLSVFIFNFIRSYISANFAIDLPLTELTTPLLFTLTVLFGISFASFIPSLKNLIDLNPKILLSGGQEQKDKSLFKNFTIITLSTLIPLVFIAIFLLENILYGLLSIFTIILLYLILAILFYYLILNLYKKRNFFWFLPRTLISYKYKDGLFGIVSTTSLYVALTSLSLLILLQSTLTQFIQSDLREGLPPLYIIDIQKSQIDSLKSNFRDVTLFPNVGARILFIDDLDIQKSIATSDGKVSREFGREYNLTYRQELLPNEKIAEGDWLQNIQNEVSVEKEFAERANIKMGSKVIFSIQGFEIESLVTSIRESDTRSGLPFFYFVFNTKDLEKYPSTFFGYSYLSEDEQNNFTKFIAQNFPNISIIDTKEITKFAQNLIGGLTIIIFVISVPPLVLALFLIITLIVSSFESRRKQSAQMMAIGAKQKFIEKLYYLETISNTILSSMLGYLSATLATIFIAKYYFKIKNVSLYNIELIIALGVIIFAIILLANLLWRGDKKPLRELLSYEER